MWKGHEKKHSGFEVEFPFRTVWVSMPQQPLHVSPSAVHAWEGRLQGGTFDLKS